MMSILQFKVNLFPPYFMISKIIADQAYLLKSPSKPIKIFNPPEILFCIKIAQIHKLYRKTLRSVTLLK